MLETPFKLVLTRNMARIQSWKPILDPSITEPVLVLNFLQQAFSRHRNGMVLWLQPVWTFGDSQ